MIHFCIFDLDGTLANSLQDLADSVNDALRTQGFPTHPVDRYRQFVGNGAELLIRRAAPSDVPEEVLSLLRTDFQRFYEAHCLDNTGPYPGCAELLNELKRRGVWIAVLSNKPDQFAGTIVRRLYPEIPFFAVCGKREGIEKKPDPTALNQMIAQSGFSKQECLYIGDGSVDVQTAHNAQIPCCGALWGFRGYQELKDAGADYFAAQPQDILQIKGLRAHDK